MYRNILLLILLLPLAAKAQIGDLPRSTPEAEGIASENVMALFDDLLALEKTEIHSTLIVRHGKVIGELHPRPFAPEYRHTVYSCSKTFLAAAIGIAIDHNLLRLDDRVALFFTDLLPDSISDNLAQMTLRDLLTMSSGIVPDWELRNQCKDWVKQYMAKPVNTPGEHFAYDSMCSHLLSVILQRSTGETLLEFLQRHLFTPMNIHDVAWERSPEGYNTGGWGLHIQSESMAKFGVLLLNDGCWNGRRLLSESWVREMTSPQIQTGGDDYGYQVWLRKAHPGSYRADGAYGQYIMVVPQKDITVVITETSLTDGCRQRDLVWKHIITPASDTPLKEGKGLKRLRKAEQNYTLPLVQGEHLCKGERLTGREIFLADNKFEWKSLTLIPAEKKLRLEFKYTTDSIAHLTAGHAKWLKSGTGCPPPYSVEAQGRFTGIEPDFIVAGSYGWQTDSTLRVKLHWVNWMSSLGITIGRHDGKIHLEVDENYSPGPVLRIEER